MPVEMTTLFSAFFLILLMEMGDKTQLITLAFSTRYGIIKTLTGISIATIILNMLAVAAGSLIARFYTIQTFIEIAAIFMFLAFGLWTLKDDGKDEEKPDGKIIFGPVTTVTLTFFIAELGDKTQLTALALTAKTPEHPLMIFLGAVFGMIIADSIGVVIGAVLGKKMPEKAIKYVSAGVFILFGLIGTYQILSEKFGLEFIQVLGMMTILLLIIGLTSYRLVYAKK